MLNWAQYNSSTEKFTSTASKSLHLYCKTAVVQHPVYMLVLYNYDAGLTAVLKVSILSMWKKVYIIK